MWAQLLRKKWETEVRNIAILGENYITRFSIPLPKSIRVINPR
jgi:hypothetical protein